MPGVGLYPASTISAGVVGLAEGAFNEGAERRQSPLTLGRRLGDRSSRTRACASTDKRFEPGRRPLQALKRVPLLGLRQSAVGKKRCERADGRGHASHFVLDHAEHVGDAHVPW